jgi:gamma-glutamyl:cysteine ligase YbdK (ATP-grasp superfamily)
LWPYEHQQIYQAFDRLFHCRGHGWANLQSVHLNLPFADDRQFRALHAAIRLLLPLLPGLAASSPYCEGAFTGNLDHRLHVYRTNARAVASVSGDVIPHTMRSEEEYQQLILQPMYRDVAPLDPEGMLQNEFLNARGAIARFSRGSIEIRLLDVAECPLVDLAICQAIVSVLQSLCQQPSCSLTEMEAISTSSLVELFLAAIEQAERARVRETALLRGLGWPHQECPNVGELWYFLLERHALLARGDRFGPPLQTVLAEGPLARRLIRAAGTTPSRGQLLEVYQELAKCLRENRMFRP